MASNIVEGDQVVVLPSCRSTIDLGVYWRAETRLCVGLIGKVVASYGDGVVVVSLSANYDDVFHLGELEKTAAQELIDAYRSK